MKKEESEIMFDTMKELADNSFDMSNKYTTKIAHFILGKVIIGWIITLIWLLVLSLK
jgi:hypothetical protein